MDATVRLAVERAIGTMRARLGDELTVDDLARAALFSKFHFARMFQQATGIPPGRFLSAMRLDEAKRLLLHTPNTVADISHRVGYSGVGTFSARFSLRVGLSPTAYRRLGGHPPRLATDDTPRQPGTHLRGHVHAPDAQPGPIFVGLFPSRITEGRPIRHAVLHRPGAYSLPDVPDGDWYVTAHWVTPAAPPAHHGGEQFTGCHGPLATRAGAGVRTADVRMHPRRMVDPPLLLALPDLRADLATAA